MPRLLILTQYYPPEMGAPQARLSESAERLTKLGWEVEVLTALPNYPTGKVFLGWDPMTPDEEVRNGVRIVRLPVLPSQTGFVRRLACYFSFAASACFWGTSMCTVPDLLWVESPPLFIGLAALFLSWRWGVPYVLNVSDLWPLSAVEMGIVGPGIALKAAEALEKTLYKNANGVTATSDEIIAYVRQIVPDKPTAVITNGVDPDRFPPPGSVPVPEPLRDLPRPIFLFAGLLGLAQGLDQLLDLAKTLPPEVPGTIVLVGDGPVRAALAARIKAESIDRIVLVPAQPREAIPAYLASSDAAVITLGRKIRGAVPSKIYEAMAARLPVLLVAEGEAARRVNEVGAGLSVEPGDRDGLKTAFARLATNKEIRVTSGAYGRRAAESRYSRERLGRLAADFLGRFVTRGGRSRTPPLP
jgi:colanic acid biosynthesis glycosyl transferase WcaI